VNRSNQPPTISTITNRIVAMDSATSAIPFTIGDLETAASSLTLSASSDDQVTVPNANIIFGGSGNNRTVTVTPAAGRIGEPNITITVSDGTATATSMFRLSVKRRPGAPGNVRFASQ
jgi:hypothetical protein